MRPLPRPRRRVGARAVVGAFALLAGLCAAASAQVPTPRSERVRYFSPADSLPLRGTLSLPDGAGPFPAVVVPSLAGVDDLVRGLTLRGWAVLVPDRRGIATIEHLLRATFDDLALDVQAGADYLRARPEVDSTLIGMVAQGGETMAGLLAAVKAPYPAFVVLLSTTGLPGDASFRIEQHQIAIDRKFSLTALADLDAFVARLTEMVVSEPSPGARAFRMREMLAETEVRLPRNAAFPPDPEDQIRFFASTWWRDLFLFRPDVALARLRPPVLVVMGEADPILPYDRHLPAIQSSLAEAPTEDATVCVLPGLVHHTMTPEIVDLVGGWLEERRKGRSFVPLPTPTLPSACLNPALLSPRR